MAYTITIRAGETFIYEQNFDSLDVAALVVYINSLPVKRSHKKKEAKA